MEIEDNDLYECQGLGHPYCSKSFKTLCVWHWAQNYIQLNYIKLHTIKLQNYIVSFP